MRFTRFGALVDPFKWLLLAGALGLGLVACGDGDDSETRVASAILTSEQETPPVVSGAVGTGTLNVEDPSGVISGNITLDGMTATAAHIHQADVGVAGPIIVTLTQTSPGVWSVPAGSVLTEAQLAAFRAGQLYFNAHSTAFPNGEIRGQIGREVFSVQVTPVQEVPPTASTASGLGVLSLDPATRRFSARLVVAGMNATAAHIHSGAIGVNGPIIYPLTQASPGVWVTAADTTFTEAELTALRAGGLYFNAHSATFPNGEIRGQIGRLVGFARLTGAQEVPPTTSAAAASGSLVVDPATRVANGAIGIVGMTTTAAHVHQAPAGTNGPIIIPLAQTSAATPTTPAIWSAPANTRLTAEQYLAFRQGNLYYNAHSAAFPNGEIRGQIRQ